MLKRENVYIRDPFIVPVATEKKHYMFGTTDKNCWGDFTLFYKSQHPHFQSLFAMARVYSNIDI